MPKSKSQSPPTQQLSPSTTHPTGSQQGSPSPMTFEDILNTPVESIEAPKPVPAGMWQFLVEGPHEQGESNQKKTPFIRFKLKLLQPHGDIDAEPAEIQKAIGRTMNFTTYFSEANKDISLNALKQFCLALGLDGTGKHLPQLLSEAPGQQGICQVINRMTQPTDGSEPQPIAEIGNRFAKV